MIVALTGRRRTPQWGARHGPALSVPAGSPWPAAAALVGVCAAATRHAARCRPDRGGAAGGVRVAGAAGLRRGRVKTPSEQLAVALFVVALLSSFVNPSLQQANYTMIVCAVALLARPADGLARRRGVAPALS